MDIFFVNEPNILRGAVVAFQYLYMVFLYAACLFLNTLVFRRERVLVQSFELAAQIVLHIVGVLDFCVFVALRNKLMDKSVF